MKRWMHWGVFVLGFACLSYLALRHAELTGDGKEYLLYTHAFSTHLTPDLRIGDVEYVNDYLQGKGSATQLDGRSLGVGHLFAGGGGSFDGKGFVKTAEGRIYAWHYWLYSLCVAPFWVLVAGLGKGAETAFVLCNLVFVLATLIYALGFWKAAPLTRVLLAGLFLSTGTTYYLWWSHPEVFTASLLLIGLLMVSDRRHGLGMWALALAATQNPPLLFLMAGVWAMTWLLPGEGAQGPLFSVGRVLAAILKGAPAMAFALMPAVFYRLELGVSNPIAAAGWADLSLVSLGRLQSMFFDLNMGMVTALPVVMLIALLVLVLTPLVLLRVSVERIDMLRRYALPVALGVLVSVVMAVPALTAINWNHGQAAFSRYAYWLSMPIVFGVAVCVGRLPTRPGAVVAAFLLISQVACVAYYGMWGSNWRADYLAFKPFASALLKMHPEWYDPLPEIFAERLSQREGVVDGSPGTGAPHFAYPDDKAPTKVMLPAKDVEDRLQLVRNTCPAASAALVERGWAYINIPPSCYGRL